MATKKTSDDFEAKAEALRKAAAVADERAEDLAAEEALKDSIEGAAAEAEAIAYVYGVLRNLNSDNASGRVIDYVATKMGLFIGSDRTMGELNRLRVELAVKNAVASSPGDRWVHNFLSTTPPLGRTPVSSFYSDITGSKGF